MREGEEVAHRGEEAGTYKLSLSDFMRLHDHQSRLDIPRRVGRPPRWRAFSLSLNYREVAFGHRPHHADDQNRQLKPSNRPWMPVLLDLDAGKLPVLKSIYMRIQWPSGECVHHFPLSLDNGSLTCSQVRYQKGFLDTDCRRATQEGD